MRRYPKLVLTAHNSAVDDPDNGSLVRVIGVKHSNLHYIYQCEYLLTEVIDKKPWKRVYLTFGRTILAIWTLDDTLRIKWLYRSMLYDGMREFPFVAGSHVRIRVIHELPVPVDNLDPQWVDAQLGSCVTLIVINAKGELEVAWERVGGKPKIVSRNPRVTSS